MSEAQPLRMQAEEMRMEMAIAENLEYTKQSLPLLLHQVLIVSAGHFPCCTKQSLPLLLLQVLIVSAGHFPCYTKQSVPLLLHQVLIVSAGHFPCSKQSVPHTLRFMHICT